MPVWIAPVNCQFSQLTVFSDAPPAHSTEVVWPDTILRADRPFSLRTQLEFLGSGAIAFLPLQPLITVSFYAKAFGSGAEMSLGQSQLPALPRTLTYQPTVTIASPIAAGLETGKPYRIIALLQVGASNAPALINGLLEDLLIEVYSQGKDEG